MGQVTFADSTDALQARVVETKRYPDKPYAVLLPRGYINRVLNHYKNEKDAKRACNRWNRKNA
jgi:hypothetical protein